VHESSPRPRGTLIHVRALGIDYGRKRVGFALSDATGLLARPWKTIEVDGDPAAVASSVAREIQELRNDPDGLDAVVIGWPRRLSGDANAQTALVEALAAHLRSLVDISVVLQDERLSSREAESLLARREKDWRKRKPLLDSAAAAVILQDYLDSPTRSGVDTGPADPTDASGIDE
jgi:putative holliday junction resolvase